jgi:hypothetical protein
MVLPKSLTRDTSPWSRRGLRRRTSSRRCATWESRAARGSTWVSPVAAATVGPGPRELPWTATQHRGRVVNRGRSSSRDETMN